MADRPVVHDVALSVLVKPNASTSQSIAAAASS